MVVYAAVWPVSGSALVDAVDPMIGAVTYPESELRGDETIHGFAGFEGLVVE